MGGGLIGLGVGILGGIAKGISRIGANKRLSKLEAQDPTYTANPIAANRLGLAQTLLNARSPGAAADERNIYGSQAAGFSNSARSATDASQLLTAGIAGQATTDQAFGNLQEKEAADYQRRQQNLIGAQEGQINEDDKVYQDEVRRFGDKAQLEGAKSENTQNGWEDISNLGFGIADFGMNGGFGNPKKKNQQGGNGYGGGITGGPNFNF